MAAAIAGFPTWTRGQQHTQAHSRIGDGWEDIFAIELEDSAAVLLLPKPEDFLVATQAQQVQPAQPAAGSSFLDYYADERQHRY
jgi:hypothetical protein